MSDSRDNQDDMHSRVDWLKPSDWPILSEIEDYGGWIKPATLSLNVPYTREHVARRCKELSEHDLLERHEDTPAYRITNRGCAYLAGDLDAEELEDSA